MCAAYTTSEEYLPDDTDGEVTLQVTDTESREIFRTRARVARTPDDLASPAPLTVVKGPHENIEEQWYIEILESEGEGERETAAAEEAVDADLLRRCIVEAREESDLLNARSEELRALVSYLVRTGEFDSTSDAVRSLLSARLNAAYPDLVDRYVDERTELEREAVASSLRGDDR
jgi:Arc/MetJ-type ribon-helix-helix transcriptional regulator